MISEAVVLLESGRVDGTGVLKGTNLTSEAEEVHRIRGRKVRIN